MVCFWAGLHDLGKISPPFQAQVPEAFRAVRAEPRYGSAPGAEGERGLRHEMATHWALAGLLAEAGYGEHRIMRLGVSHQVAQMLGGHHGCFGRVLQPREAAAAGVYQPGLGGAGWAEQRRVHFAELRRVTGAREVPAGGLPAELAVVVAGLVIVADWLASQVDFIGPLLPAVGWQGTAADLDEHWRRACEAAPGAVAAAQLGRAEFGEGAFEEVFPFSPNPLQADLAEQLPKLVESGGAGLVLVTAPTGDGKTEAALHSASVLGRASGARGVFVALPTMATADAMFPRLRQWVEAAVGGSRAMSLLHSMAWLSPVYVGEAAASGGGGTSSDPATALEAGVWLRGRHRGLLAPLGVGTIDQVLSGVLPLPFNVLRLFGLSDKVFVVDEAHAYGPWMHFLLVRLLEWLGAFGTPVVLLSATLTGESASSLVNAYRRGAGFPEACGVQPRYPGWLFVPARTGEVSQPRAVVSERPRQLDVALRRVAWDCASPDGAVAAGGRREALRQELLPVVEQGGCALVCCTTVAEAQQTFRDLQAAFPELAAQAGGLRLLHSRFPADVRARITGECKAAYGKPGREGAAVRPASVLVATQVVEQSLDLDFDLVVSDLAPLAQLLQRAGRGRRHARGPQGRPPWAWPEDRPRLVVLEPVDGDRVTAVPRSWGTVYDPGLLRRTALLLAAEAGEGIEVPDGVQRLVDAVYTADFTVGLDAAAGRELMRMDVVRQAGAMAESQLAALVTICSPEDVGGDLQRLSLREAGVTQELLTTRLGADSGRVVCLYEQPGGVFSLDPGGEVAVPGGRPSRDEVAAVMLRVAPVPGGWLQGTGEAEAPPAGWRDKPLLRELTLVRMRPAGEGVWSGQLGGRVVLLSEVGLERP